MLTGRHARRTLALFTLARAIHRDPTRTYGLAPRIIAEEAGVPVEAARRCREGRPISLEDARKMAAWNGLDLDRLLESESRPGAVATDGRAMQAGVLKAADFAGIFPKGFQP